MTGSDSQRRSSRAVLSRRRLLQYGGTAAALGMASQLIGPTAAWADTYDSMRGTWFQLLTGTGFNPASAPFSGALASLGSTASRYQSTMAPASSSLWPDLPVGSVSANVTSSYSRLKTMALAYAQPNTGLTGNASLVSAITTGLDWMQAQAYAPTTIAYNNWWDWQIGAPQSLLDTCILTYGNLTPAQIDSYCASIDHFVPTSAVSSYTGTSTGANRVDLCRVLALRGAIGRVPAPISTAQTALSPVMPYVLAGDGIYADGSFIQHTYVPYTGTYGAILIGGVARLITLLSGTSWAITDPNIQDIFNAVSSCYAPVVYNGLAFDGQSGRAISRSTEDAHTRGHALASDVLLMAESGAFPGQTASWKAIAKGWIQRDTTKPYMNDSSVAVPELARAQALLNDTTVTAAAEPVCSQVFGMDRAIHRRQGWAAQISACSSRTTFYETGNGENLHGWHTNSGMLYWYGSTYGNDQHSDAFWPTVDPYMLPGTTVSTLSLADAAGGEWGASHPATAWAGGATDGTWTAFGQDVRGLQSSLTGKKSWFCLDDSIVCLGAGITCADGAGVQTTIDNRNLGSNNTQALWVDGAVQDSTLGWDQTFANAHYMSIDGMASWIFPGGANVSAKRIARTGAWSAINTGGPTAQITKNYVTMWFDHGTDPVSATYCYQLMPGAGAAAAAARSANPDFAILANTPTVQAISCPGLGLTMANFFAAGTAGPLTASGPCSILMSEKNGSMTIAVSDPTRGQATVQITIASDTYPGISSTSGINVLTTAGLISLLAEVGGTHGTTLTACLSGSGTSQAPRTAAQLAATATTYVRDGSYANTNYGGQTTMIVKNDTKTSTGYNREALLKFDVSSVSGHLNRAILWVNGSVNDSGGTQTTLQAFATASDMWTETAVTWSTAPSLTTALGTGTLGAAADWVGLDVTAAVASALTGSGGDGIASLGVWEPGPAPGLATILQSRLNNSSAPQLEIITQ